ncbi:transferase [Enterobacter cancerogenus]|uniref:Transferase n=1 Tax=Enterobacter cancerogenus TaxID=69218 RepID=A0A484YWT4_9ENTR|nr:transferase [Enterobacter cancerogenus]
MQELNGFSVPKGFRGGNGIKVQLWWRFRQRYLPGLRKYCTAGEHFYCACLVQKSEKT